jgi:uncharacterized membrane protein YhfC
MDMIVTIVLVFVSLALIGLPIMLVRWLAKTYRIEWRVFGYGALFLLVAQIINTPLFWLAQDPLSSLLKGAVMNETVLIIVISVILGFAVGIVEEVGKYLVMRYYFKARKLRVTKENAVGLGAGWGGIECLLVGLAMLMVLFSYVSASPLTEKEILLFNSSMNGSLTTDQVDFLVAENDRLMNLQITDILPGLVERILWLALQIALSILVFYAVMKKDLKFLYLAIAWHAVVNAVIMAMGQFSGMVVAELIFIMMSLGTYFYLKSEWPHVRKRAKLDVPEIPA